MAKQVIQAGAEAAGNSIYAIIEPSSIYASPRIGDIQCIPVCNPMGVRGLISTRTPMASQFKAVSNQLY